MNKLFVISGSSGVGKGTIIKNFLSLNTEIKLSVSTTTRKPRPQEKHGTHYFYVSKEEFTQAVKNDEFLEWAQFSENYYGTKKSFVNECINNKQDVLLEIDTQGALQIRNKMPEAVLIFIAPPSLEELKIRLQGRQTEDDATIQKRLEFVELEQKNSKYFDYIIVNDILETAVKNLDEIIKKECNE